MEAARAELGQIDSQLIQARSALGALNSQLAGTPASLNTAGSGGGGGGNPALAQAQGELAAMRARDGAYVSFPSALTFDQWNFWFAYATRQQSVVPFEAAMTPGSDRAAAISFDAWKYAVDGALNVQ